MVETEAGTYCGKQPCHHEPFVLVLESKETPDLKPIGEPVSHDLNVTGKSIAFHELTIGLEQLANSKVSVQM
jgi:hypothetical protein